MKEVNGKYTSAKIFTDVVEETALSQIAELCNQSFLDGNKISIMPDVHAGKGCTIGTTIAITDKVVPNLVGVDIGCGVLTAKLGKQAIDFANLDSVIRSYVPVGKEVHDRNEIAEISFENDFEQYRARHILSEERWVNSLGTLGGGNHFIEMSEDEEGFKYLTIHTGSRYTGARIANYYQKLAISQINKIDIAQIIERLKAEGRHKEIQQALLEAKANQPKISDDLAYLSGESFDDYIHDMKLTQRYAVLNRQLIAERIIQRMGFEVIDQFDTIHNYIDTDNMILRKGAVSAQKGERLIIPINMRDGSIIAVGKGNPDWNYSAPHGAGRVLSRRKAHKELNFTDFAETMQNVWSTTVTSETLDEAPMAYKNMRDILDNVHETVDIVKIIKPVFNFKACD